MATHDYIISNASGAAVRADLNNALAAIATNNSSATAPTTTYAYQWWADTGSSPTVMKLRNAANSAWITLFQLDGEWSLIPFENGTAAAPSIYFKDSGTDTGIYSPGTDQVAITTGGTGRLFVDSSGRVGLGTSSADNKLSVGIASADEGIELKATYNGARVARFAILNPSVDNTPYIGSVSGNDFGFITSGTRRMTLTSGGSLGIGTTAPDEKLTVTDGVIRLNSTTSTSKHILFYDTAGIRHVIGSDATAGTNELGIRSEGQIIFGAGSGRGEAARIDASKRLLVGTSTARTNFHNNGSYTTKVQIEGTDFQTSALSLVCNSTTDFDSTSITLAKSGGSTIGSNTLVANGEELGSIRFEGNDGTEFVEAAKIIAEVDGTPGANDMPGRLIFSTTADGASSPTERMRIDQNGLIKTFSTGNGHTVNVSAGGGTSTFIYAGNRSSTDTQGSGGTTVYYVYSNGNVQNTNGSYTTLSDAKLKENIVDAHSQWNDLKAIQIRNWNFKEETGHETHRQIGPIAQELETVCPGLVFEAPDLDEDGNETGEVTKGVNQSVLYMKAVKALQEAMERIEQLETEMAEVKAQLQAS
jgi:hypothetical protein